MFDMIWPILVVVAANVVYNICQKSMPQNVNPFASLTVTYLVATLLSGVIFLLSTGGKNLVGEMKMVNWTAFALGLGIVFLEVGFVYIYRNGWKVSTGALVANIVLSIVLLVIGVVFYKDKVSLKQVAGIVLCGAGLILITV